MTWVVWSPREEWCLDFPTLSSRNLGRRRGREFGSRCGSSWTRGWARRRGLRSLWSKKEPPRPGRWLAWLRMWAERSTPSGSFLWVSSDLPSLQKRGFRRVETCFATWSWDRGEETPLAIEVQWALSEIAGCSADCAVRTSEEDEKRRGFLEEREPIQCAWGEEEFSLRWRRSASGLRRSCDGRRRKESGSRIGVSNGLRKELESKTERRGQLPLEEIWSGGDWIWEQFGPQASWQVVACWDERRELAEMSGDCGPDWEGRGLWTRCSSRSSQCSRGCQASLASLPPRPTQNSPHTENTPIPRINHLTRWERATIGEPRERITYKCSRDRPCRRRASKALQRESGACG